MFGSLVSSRYAGVLGVAVMVLPMGASAGVVNGSFESPAASNDGGTASLGVNSSATNWNGWDYTSPWAVPIAIRNPNDSLFPGTAGLNTAIPSPGDGFQMVMMVPSTAMYQTLSDTVQPNQTCTVTAAVGRALADGASTAEVSIWALNPSNPTGALTQQLFLASQTVNTTSAGGILPVSFSYQAPATGTMIGQPLIIALRDTGSAAVYFDNVVVSVPEPTGIVGIGVAGAFALRRARRRS